VTDVLLEAQALEAGFGANQVLHGIDLTVRRGEIAGIFGLNGAGKSVTMKVVSGLVPAWRGAVHFEGRDITRLAPEARVGLGIGNVPQGRQVFGELTVEENLRVGAYTSRRRDRAGYAGRLAGVYDRLPMVAEKKDALAGSLSGGQRAALAVGRALINDPKLLLVDEPSAGLAPVVVDQLFEVLHAVAATGMTMVLVEQNVAFGLRLADTAHLMQSGRVVFAGPVAELDRDQLARHLGIGAMLQSSVAAALDTRLPTPAKKPTAAKKKTAAKKRRAR
jgi:branched-chain amino acid transport system ATP-binding protein